MSPGAVACDRLRAAQPAKAGRVKRAPAIVSASLYAPRPKEFRFAGDTPPAVRVSEAFAQFAAGQGKPNKRYSSLTTILR